LTLESVYHGATAFAALFGALFGSFMNVCIARMPEDRSVVYPGSACPSCGASIKPYDNVPVFAWIWLRGRCRSCKAEISPLYPMVEALFAVAMALLFRHVVPDLADFNAAHLVAFVWYGWLFFAILAMTFIDLRHRIIPDEFSIYSVPVGILGAAFLGYLGYEHAPSWQQSVIGALVGGGLIAALIGGYWLWKGEEGMGWGDAKLLALFGAYFGAFPALLFILFSASVVGSIVGVSTALAKRSSLKLAIAFGPFLGMGAVLWMFFGRQITIVWMPGLR
jgi:leader peptidase (prepilin peptidase)/N-methyltransferase